MIVDLPHRVLGYGPIRLMLSSSRVGVRLWCASDPRAYDWMVLHIWQAHTYLRTAFRIPGQKKQRFIFRYVSFHPGWLAASWSWNRFSNLSAALAGTITPSSHSAIYRRWRCNTLSRTTYSFRRRPYVALSPESWATFSRMFGSFYSTLKKSNTDCIIYNVYYV